MNKSILALLFALSLSTLSGQSKELIYSGDDVIGYINDQGTPVLEVQLTKENEKLFRFEYGDYIYQPRQDSHLTDTGKAIPEAPKQTNQPSYQPKLHFIGSSRHSSQLIRAASINKSIAVGVSYVASFFGGMVMVELPVTGSAIVIAGALTAIGFDLYGNFQLNKAADSLLYEEASKNSRLKELEEELEKLKNKSAD